MPGYSLSPRAYEDIEGILIWSYSHFGSDARDRYRALLEQALLDITDDPGRAGSHHRREIGELFHTYHLRHSRHRVGHSIGRVRQPRHFLLFAVHGDNIVVLRVLHDSMDLGRIRDSEDD